eukprot:52599_1
MGGAYGEVKSQSGNSDPLQNLRSNVEKLYHQKSAVWFREPVDWKALNILDYPEKVKNPMDLGTVMKKLNYSEYNSVEEGASDIRLVFENCLSYNSPTSSVYSAAESLYRKFEEIHVKDFPDQFNFNRAPMVEEKQRLSKDLARVPNEQLAAAVSMLEARPGGSIDIKTDKNLVINIDAIPYRTFWEMYRYLRLEIQKDAARSKRKIPYRIVDGARFGISKRSKVR